MTRYVIDAWAWMEYLDGSAKGDKVRTIIEGKGSELYSSAVSLTEVMSKLMRTGKDAGVALRAVTGLSRVVEADARMAAAAAECHARMRKKSPDFGLGDAFVVAAASSLDAKVVTGDPHFEGLPGVVMV